MPLPRPVIFTIFVVFLAAPAFAQSQLTACGPLDKPRSTYILQNDVSSPGTCFLVRAEGITLDLNQHVITYGTGSSWKPGDETVQHVHGILGQACWDTAGRADPSACGGEFNLLTVKNGSIAEAPNAPPYSHAIRLGQGAIRNLTVDNLHVRISSPSTIAILVVGGRGGHKITRLRVDNDSQYVFNRHQLEGANVRLVEAAREAAPNLIQDLTVIGGPQVGVVETTPGSTITGANIRLKASFTNDFGIFLLADRISAKANTIIGRSRGIQVDAVNDVVEKNLIRTYEEPNNEEYDGCQLGGTYGIQLEARSRQALVQENDVTVSAEACDARAFRVTEAKAGNANRSTRNIYRAVKKVADAPGKAVAASFSAAREALLEGDTLEADTWNAEITWGGGKNITLRGVTFIKGPNAGKDYATFSLAPGSNNAIYQPTSAEMKVIDPIFRNGASADSFFMHPIGFEKWATPAQYFIQWTFALIVVDSSNAPLPGVLVRIVDHLDRPVLEATTGTDGRIPALPLTQFRRYNTPQAIEKEEFRYDVSLSLADRKRSFRLNVTQPTQRTEILP